MTEPDDKPLIGTRSRPYRDPGRAPKMSEQLDDDGVEFVTQAGRGRISTRASRVPEPRDQVEERVPELPVPTSRLTSRPA